MSQTFLQFYTLTLVPLYSSLMRSGPNMFADFLQVGGQISHFSHKPVIQGGQSYLMSQGYFLSEESHSVGFLYKLNEYYASLCRNMIRYRAYKHTKLTRYHSIAPINLNLYSSFQKCRNAQNNFQFSTNFYLDDNISWQKITYNNKF